jgi:hypothetical protein
MKNPSYPTYPPSKNPAYEFIDKSLPEEKCGNAKAPTFLFTLKRPKRNSLREIVKKGRE